jgi:hypothetical protein
MRKERRRKIREREKEETKKEEDTGRRAGRELGGANELDDGDLGSGLGGNDLGSG